MSVCGKAVNKPVTLPHFEAVVIVPRMLMKPNFGFPDQVFIRRASEESHTFDPLASQEIAAHGTPLRSSVVVAASYIFASRHASLGPIADTFYDPD
jgi:hypothetical protein